MLDCQHKAVRQYNTSDGEVWTGSSEEMKLQMLTEQ